VQKHWRPRLKGQVKGCVMNFVSPKLEMKDDVLLWGYVRVYRDGELQMEFVGWESGLKVGHIAAVADNDPDRDWIIQYSQPLSDAYYQKQGDGWYLVEVGEGFA